MRSESFDRTITLGTLDTTCLLTNHITLSDGQQVEQTGKLRIRAK